MGFEIDALTLDETLAEIDTIIERGRPVQHCAINAAKAVRIETDARLRKVVSSCALVSADGVPIVWASRCWAGRCRGASTAPTCSSGCSRGRRSVATACTSSAPLPRSSSGRGPRSA